MYRAIITIHAITIIFFVVIPALVGGFGNLLLPLHIFRGDIGHPRGNITSFTLLPGALLLVILSLLIREGPGTR